MNCATCDRRILQHSSYMQCAFCNNTYHIACLPYSSQNITDYGQIERWMCFQCTETEFPFNHFESDSLFLESLSEYWYKNKHFPFKKFEHYEFNPFELNETDSLLNINSSDPDLQYFNDQSFVNTINCDYYLENGFVSKTSKLCTYDCFSLFHLNIRSVPKNLSQLKCYCEGLQFSFTVVGLSETWLNESSRDLYAIDGYQHFNCIRDKKRGGGVSLFVKNNFNVISRTDLDVMSDNIEALFIELKQEETRLSKNAIIGIIYRPPGQDIKDFCDKLAEILLKIKVEDKLVYVMGDFNLNILESDNHLPTSNFIELMYSNSLFPLISRPTRVTKNKASLIDNIFCNDISSTEKLNGILCTEISDHYPEFTINYKAETKNEHFYKARVYSSKNIKTFTSKLIKCDWKLVLDNNDGKAAFSDFHKKFCHIYNE